MTSDNNLKSYLNIKLHFVYYYRFYYFSVGMPFSLIYLMVTQTYTCDKISIINTNTNTCKNWQNLSMAHSLVNSIIAMSRPWY